MKISVLGTEYELVKRKWGEDKTFEKHVKRLAYKVVEFAGFVYTMIDNLVRKLG